MKLLALLLLVAFVGMVARRRKAEPRETVFDRLRREQFRHDMEPNPYRRLLADLRDGEPDGV